MSLPDTSTFSDRIPDKSRFHSIYISDDKVPMLLGYLDPAYRQLPGSDMPEKFISQIYQDEVSGYCIVQVFVYLV